MGLASSRSVRVGLGCLLLLASSAAWGQTNNQCDEPGEFPDVIVGVITGQQSYGSIGGISAFSFGTTSCNQGKCWLKWIASTNEHPVIGQGMYRLKNGRFEQIGQSWLKHGFTALQEGACSPPTCMPSGTGSRLGVNCSDPYSSSLNGSQGRLGPKFQATGTPNGVNGYTGEYPYPPFNYSNTGNAIYKRLQVHNVDLDPGQNAGAQYWVEAQYITADDALGGNGDNNASYRPVNITTGTNPPYSATLTATTVRKAPAIKVWKVIDPSVVEASVSSEGDGSFNVSAKVTDLGDGFWHYEYAVHNLNSHRAAGTFRVPLPLGATVRNTDFHDVDYHSGDFVDGTDWERLIETVPPAVSWSTESFTANAAANSLRWGTLYNFRFDADVPPTTGTLELGLWRPGTPSSISVVTVVPLVCDNDGTCDPSETCLRCPSDCGPPGPGGECCGNGVCQPSGESPCVCPADCGSPATIETSCTNQQDDDCDSFTDCTDTDCCSDGTCVSLDSDGDLHPAPCDCDDSDGTVWDTPGESGELTLWRGGSGEAMLGWQPPTSPGGSAPGYDTLRTSDPTNFDTAAICVPAADPLQTTNMDFEDPHLDEIFYYLVRARNSCPAGDGTLGNDSTGAPRVGRLCP